ncbi:MAG: hypothetical protein HYX68_06375 [Planctomycetes bacterium]|nr:hypothetical protein [Planctomycetota bacterium]
MLSMQNAIVDRHNRRRLAFETRRNRRSCVGAPAPPTGIRWTLIAQAKKGGRQSLCPLTKSWDREDGIVISSCSEKMEKIMLQTDMSICLAVRLGFLALSGIVAQSARGQPLPDNLVKEILAKSSDYDQHTLSLQVNEKTWILPPGQEINGRVPDEHSQIKRDRAGQLLMYFFEKDDLCTCVAKNAYYAFRLEKKKRSDKWVIAKIYRNLLSQETKDFLETYFGIKEKGSEVGTRYPGPYELFNLSVVSIMKDPGFRVTKKSQVVRDNRNLWRIDFVCTIAEDVKSRHTWHYPSGSLIVDPQRYFALHAFEANIAWPGRLVQSVALGTQEIHETKNGVPYAKSAIIQLKNNQKGERIDLNVHRQWTIEDREPSWEEFTLSAFGFPEPPGVPEVRSGSRWYLWVLAAAAIAIAVGWFFRRRMLRGARAPAPEKGIRI